MVLVGYFNEGHPVFSVTEKEVLAELLSVIITNYVNKDTISAEMFDNKILSLNENKEIVSTPTKVNKKVNENPIDEFIETSKGYEEGAYFFDLDACFEYNNENFRQLEEKDFLLVTCKHCGKKVLKKDSVCGCCEECFVNDEIKNMLEEAKECSEEFTEYEKLSEVFNTIELFKEKIKSYAEIKDVPAKAKEVIDDYVNKQNLPEKYTVKVLGGLA